MRTTPQGGSSHAPKDFPLWGLLTKDYKVYTMVFTKISTFYFNSHMLLLQVLIQLTTWSYWMQIMSSKVPISTLIYLKEKNGWIVNHIHLHLFPMYQTDHQVPLINFHHYMDRFYIIESLGFSLVYIFDLPLLLTQNTYLNYL